jgi:hypothetical protein
LQEKETMRTRYYWACLCGITAVMISLPKVPAFAELESAIQPPPYKLNRADENYRYLRDPARHSDFWDPLKYVPLLEVACVQFVSEI